MQSVALLPAVLCALMGGPCAASVDVAKFSSLQGRVIKAGFRDKTITAESELDCVLSMCAGRLSSCAVSYSRQDRQCVSAPLNGWLIVWDSSKFTDTDPNWTTYVTKVSPDSIVRPAVLYLLDSVNRGANLGSKGSQVDLIETGLTAWNAPGPRGDRSHLKYLVSGSTNRAQIPYKISAGSYHFDLSGQFSIAVWIKTDTSVGMSMPIVEGQPYWTLPDFWFSGNNQDQMFFARQQPKNLYKSPVNSTGKQFWRHLALVYAGFRDVQFYLNGSTFGQTLLNGATQDVLYLPSSLFLGNEPFRTQLFADMACLTIYEKALSQKEIAALMTVCP